jgi:hypothetical protein
MKLAGSSRRSSRGDRALWATAIYAGLRHSELRALQVRDVDLERRRIEVQQGWDQYEGEIEPKSERAPGFGAKQPMLVEVCRSCVTQLWDAVDTPTTKGASMRALALSVAATLALSGTAVAATGQQISVNGTGGASVPSEATDAQQQTAYDQALTTAISDAQRKAQMVAQQLLLTLGPLQSFTEQSEDYLGYCGVGFLPGVAATGVSGSASTPAAAGSGSGHLTPIPAKPKKHKTKKAHKTQESNNTCQLEADVTVTYSTS